MNWINNMKYLFKKRNEITAEPARIAEIAKELGVSNILAELLYVRGIMQDTGAFLNPDIRNMYDPNLFSDMRKAAAIIRAHIAEKKKICIYGDYDSDGVNAAAILYLTLRKMGGDAFVYLPKRAEGYGMNAEAVKKIAHRGADLLVTVDCGISNVAEVRTAKELGMTVIVTDHHECPEELPDADAILNPKREGEKYPFRELCGGGVAFKLACALTGKAAFELIDFAAVATIGDVVPLLSENRIITAKGLYKLSVAPSTGLKILIREAGINKKPINSEGVAFGLVPRINAAGRLEDPLIAFRLLCGMESPTALETYAKKCCALNLKRQGLQESIVRQCMEMAAAYADARVFVLQDDAWDAGIVGLAASALVERFAKPALLFGMRGGLCTGSARSVDGVNIYNALKACGDLLEAYGGHEAAAGMSVKKENLSALREALNQYMYQKHTEEDFMFREFYDMEAKIADINCEVIRELHRLKPFGSGNEQVKILLRNVTVMEKRAIGNGKHSRVVLSQDGAVIGGVKFGTPASEIPDRMDALVSAQISDYNGAAEVIVDVISY